MQQFVQQARQRPFVISKDPQAVTATIIQVTRSEVYQKCLVLGPVALGWNGRCVIRTVPCAARRRLFPEGAAAER